MIEAKVQFECEDAQRRTKELRFTSRANPQELAEYSEPFPVYLPLLGRWPGSVILVIRDQIRNKLL